MKKINIFAEFNAKEQICFVECNGYYFGYTLALLSVKIRGCLIPVGYYIRVVVCSLARMGGDSLSFYTYLLFSFTMPKNNENAHSAKNSTAMTRPAHETGLVYNLSKDDIYQIFSSYFEFHRKCTVAIFEAFEALQKRLIEEPELDYEAYVSETLSIIALVDNAEEALRPCINNYHGDLTEEAIININNHLTGIIKKVEQKGVFNFITEATSLPSIVKTKSAIEDTLVAFGCVFSLYIAYERSLPCDGIRRKNEF